MAIHNSQVAEIFNNVADLLEIDGANEFRIRAYRNAARTIGSLPTAVSDLLDRGEDLSELPGIGKDLAGKVREIVGTGHLRTLDAMEEKFPENILQLMHVTGLGPKRVRILDRLGINSLEKLRQAAEKGKLHRISGFGTKTEHNLLETLERDLGGSARTKLFVAEQIANSITKWLAKSPGAQQTVVAGSLRRRRETVGDLDVVVTCAHSAPVMDHFLRFEEITKTLARGDTKSSVILESGIQVDVRIVKPESFGAALLYLTGSKAHNIELRKIALKRGLKINEYGVFKGEKRVAGETEEAVYAAIGLPYIEPELRENTGEIEAAQRGELPHLIELRDLCGDLHGHTNASDGRNSIAEMAEAARSRGYEFIAITDHSKRLGITHGLDEKRVAEQITEVDRFNEKSKGFRLLKGIEVDILDDGSMDLPNSVLARLDIVIGSIHSKLRLPKEKQTERLLRAIANPHCDIIGHPTGRLLNEREGSDFDVEKVMRSARVHGKALEVNSQPDRLDLRDAHCRMARDLAVLLAISTDAHTTTDLDFIHFGVEQARRGWTEKSNVLNCRTAAEILAWSQTHRL